MIYMCIYNNNFVDIINDLHMLHARNFAYCASIMLNAFNTHYAQNYAGIIGACKPNNSLRLEAGA